MSQVVPNHRVFAEMSDKAKDAFPDADYVIAVKHDPATGDPMIDVLVRAEFAKPVTTDLSGTDVINDPERLPIQLRPAKGEMLRTFAPDASVAYCVNRPRWVWLSMLFSNVP